MSLPTGEQWRSIEGYEGLYEVSDLGRVRSLDRYVVRRNKTDKPAHYRGRVLRPQSAKQGRDRRLQVTLSKDGVVTIRRISVLVLEAFVGPRPEGYEGCHNDGDVLNNHLSNLRWDTPSENMRDKVRHGHCQFTNRTHCPRGHLLSQPNLVASIEREGRRACLACSRARGIVVYLERTGRPFDFQATADAKYEIIMGDSDLAVGSTLANNRSTLGSPRDRVAQPG